MKIITDIAKIKQWLFSNENMTKTTIRILQNSEVTQNQLGGLIIHHLN